MYRYLIVFLLFIYSCQSRIEKLAWEATNTSHTNSKELVKFLQHYKNLHDSKRYKAACFLVANMPNKYSVNLNGNKIYYIDIVLSDSLVASLEYSFSLLETTPFLKEYSFDDFCEYILPYRVANEPLEYYWKWDIPQRIGRIYGDDIAQYAAAINMNIKTNNSRESWGNPLLGYAATIAENNAKCDDIAILTVMAMRSYGIPSAMEFIPYWGGTNNSHSLCSVTLPNDSIVVFQNTNDDGENIIMSNKTPKIYRHLFSLQRNTTLFKYRNEECNLNLFSNFRLTDVTSLHNIDKQNCLTQYYNAYENKITVSVNLYFMYEHYYQ